MKNILIGIAVLLLIIGGVYYVSNMKEIDTSYEKINVPEVITEEVAPVETPGVITEEVTEAPRGPQSIIGQSANGEDIVAYHFGTGAKEVVLVGGTHGGYSWNTALLGFELVDWFASTPGLVPADVTVTIIPVLNPDGLKLVTGKTGKFTATDVSKSETTKVAGRFNANDVDLNRNFACEWNAVGTWQNKEVSGGSAPFSEAESQAVRDYVLKYKPAAAVTWYSAAGGVYASNCNNGLSDGTKRMTDLFAKASGYPAHEEFNYYEITGDMTNWFASQNIPAISVLLTTHDNTELTKNKAGVEAVIKYLAN